MANWLVELKHSGLPNRTVAMPDEIVLDCWATIQTLSVAAIRRDVCWQCRGHELVPVVDYLLSYRVAGETEYAIVTGEYVISAFKGTLIDRERNIRKIGNRCCTHDPGKHKNACHPCGCGSPVDAEIWLPLQVCEASNCFNYAARDVWCRGIEPGRATGAIPRSTPVNRTSYEEWAGVLAPDGILRADATLTPPDGHNGGWHIALASNGTDFHFLRLDGDYWTHKSSVRPPQMCDTKGNLIPKHELESAHLCGFNLVGYFFVPHPLSLDR
jgi:hypothetical protein